MTTLPPGVTLQQIDGGPNYYADNGFTYAVNAGWDNPSFVPIGPWLAPMLTQSDANRWLDLNWNTAFTLTANSDLSLLRSNGIRAILQSDELSKFGSTPSSETVGLLTADEGGITDTQNAIGTIANSIQDGRFWYINNTWNFINYGDLSGIPAPQVLSMPFTTPNGTSRHIDVQSVDIYYFAGGKSGNDILGQGGLIYNLGRAMTPDEAERGSNYGDMIDAERAYQGAHPAPIVAVIEDGGPTSASNYITPPELNWAVWSSLIHGARAIDYFNHTFVGPGESQDNLAQPFYQTIQPGQTISIYDQVKATDALIEQLAPVLNSPFALNYVTVNGSHYDFGTPDHTLGGLELMAKDYNGQFYIFADTRDSETQHNIPATFTIADLNATSVTVVNENRTLPVTNGVFTDTFANAWTVHIYQVNDGSGPLPPPPPPPVGGSFGPPMFTLAAFGPGAGGWTSQNLYPRLLADINNDGNADIVGFAGNGAYVSSANGTGGFQAPAFANGTSFWGAQTGGWSSQDAYPREVADAHGSHLAEIVGFASNGVYVSLANGLGGFQAPMFANGTSFWGAQTGGWSSQDKYPRELADVNNDQIADIVGFASNGVHVSRGDGNGGFSAPTFMGGSFWGAQTGGWSSQDTYTRFMADADGDGYADIVGFAQGGVYVSLNQLGAAFLTPAFVPGSSFWGAQTGGWSSQNLYPRSMADVNGDGKADIVGFAQSGIYVSIDTSTAGNVSFDAPTLVPNSSFWGASTGGWSSNNLYPRELANITNGDTKADIVGFAQSGVWTSISTSTVSVPSGGVLGPVSVLDPGPSATSSPAVTNTGNEGGNVIVGSPFSNNEEITGADIMEFTGAVASGQMVTFDPNSTGTLKLDNSPGFAGTVAGLALGNHIDLTDIQFSSVRAPTYTPNAGNSGGTLTVTDGQHTANIALLGQYMAGSFATSSDGHGGTLITDPRPFQETPLTQPHA